MPLFAGRILLRDEVVQGWLEAEGGRIVGWGEGDAEATPHARGWIVPSPVNAHTHAADTFLRSLPGKPRTVPELVGPGGWKQQQLARATPEQAVAGMAAYAAEMAQVGTTAFVDFREGGVIGARLLRDAAERLPVRPFILGRPQENDFHDDEAGDLLAVADGVGLSALRDFPRQSDAAAWAEACRRRRKTFALHASEVKREDVDAVLALAPAFVVHAIQATRADFNRLADDKVPVVVCPRSSAYYGMRTPIARMLEAGVTVAVGTDNGMLSDGNLLAELGQLHDWAPGVTDADLLRMATYHGRDLIGMATPRPKRGGEADWIVLPDAPLPVPAGRRKPELAPHQDTEAP